MNSLHLFVIDKGANFSAWEFFLYFMVAFLYGCITLISLILLRKLWSLSTIGYVGEGVKTQKFFLSFLSLSTTIRCIFFCLLGSYYFLQDVKAVPANVWFVLSTLPSDFFLTAFTILLFFWARLYHFSISGKSIATGLIVSLNTLLYIFLIVEYVIYFMRHRVKMAEEGKQLLIYISNFFGAIFSVILAIIFLYYCIKLYGLLARQSNPYGQRSERLERGLKKLVILSIICTSCFLIRSSILLLDSVYSIEPWLFLVIYFVLSEIFPSLLLLLYVFRKQPMRTASQRNINVYGSHNYSLLTAHDEVTI